MSIQFEPCYSVVNGKYPKLDPTIVAQSRVTQIEFAFKRNFRCFWKTNGLVLPVIKGRQNKQSK